MRTMDVLTDKSITDVPYFKAAGIHSGLKKNEKKDLCVIFSEKECVAAASFTTNKVKAAPVQLNMKHIESKNIQAIVVNAGNANACTGDDGYQKSLEMAKITANCLGIKPVETLVASTGVIGVPLPMDIVVPGIRKACEAVSSDGGNDAAEAIITTDTCTKKVTVKFNLGSKTAMISGMAKGSGMIHPNMATMLGFIVTDANITKSMLTRALKESVEESYNMISVDGDTSTNDMVMVLANGAAENPLISSEDISYFKFKEALHYVNVELAKMIAQDGEGATKLIEVKLYNARSLKDARICAKSVITSSLVKAAFFGNDANWGRILCALGYSDGNFNPNSVDVLFSSDVGTVQICRKGASVDFDEDLATKILNREHVTVAIDLHDGEYNATAWGCDLTYDYVKINGSYRS
ncbi:MAG: bifunctional glutamate N-acetyltransferase/amino-acid acetyltransferase ArgJ [Bacillota bacterium]|nr:bifunctional glutamate N-acetyltransferase/amino-acid acetyltransferase ArgJ [Bacillota bacterium]